MLCVLGFGCGGHSTRSEPAAGGNGTAIGDGGTAGDAAAGGQASGGVRSATPSETACGKNSECVLARTRCCQCNVFDLTEGVALHRDHRSSYERATCGETATCPPCTPSSRTSLLAACEAGHCIGVDLVESPITACNTSADCKMRVNRCCGCDGVSGPLIAIASAADAAWESLRCDPDAACAECAESIPDGPDRYLLCFDGRCSIGGFVP